ncbi:MAG TPA: transcription termination factor Rho [Micromonosporaceae bacterium]|nr:transcription termination factor Rho [Micromonosporaceae bacterium]
MSDTTDVTSGVNDATAPEESAGASRRRRTGGGLTSMLLPELQTMATSLGISGTARMRKGELIAAIQERTDGRVPGPRSTTADTGRGANTSDAGDEAGVQKQSFERAAEPVARSAAPVADEPRADATDKTRIENTADTLEGLDRAAAGGQNRVNGRRDGRDRRAGTTSSDRLEGDVRDRDPRGNDRGDRDQRGQRNERDNRGDRAEQQRTNDRGDRNDRDQRNDRGQRSGDDQRDGDDDEGSRRSRRSRFRERNRRGRERGEGGGGEPQVNDDDVLVPVAGIVDVLDNYAFVRTSGYLSGPNDVYVSMAQIKRYGLRRGDAVTGAVRSVREGGEGRRDKYNPLIRLDTINGMDVEESRRRPEFYKLTPLYPQDRLRLETEPHVLTTRVIDLVMPIGKGQRALIVSPPKAGKTMVLQAIANAITHNNPECHLMVVLVDERPEEVTDMQRSVKGEVIASTFDRPPSDHTTVAELSIERAKRLVELGHDVVVLLDSITRLGRAYNNASPASGRILSGGIDSTALYPPKRFLGAARNIEHGGSLTIIATALVETGSTGDTVIFEEFKGTGNSELRLDRKIADKRVFPAIDIDPSGTRKEEILLAPDELAIVLKLRKVLHALDSQQAIDLLLDRLKKTRTNIEFLMQIAQSTPGE